MPIMIPDPIPESASDSEKAIFETLKVAAEGRSWEVLYQASTEEYQFDFVILMPYEKSVICLEVEDPNSPTELSIEQTRNAMEGMRQSFPTYFDCSSLLSLGYAVVFSDGEETEEWLLPEHLKPLVHGTTFPSFGLTTGNGDEAADALHANSLALTLWNYAVALSEDVSYEDSKKAQLMLNELRTKLVATGETITQIATIFHDNLETHHPQLLRLIDDQLKILQLVGCQFPTETDNPESKEGEPRCVIDGAAGTGKTVLAIEIARQRCEAGETVGLLCSNPYLSRRFANWTEILSGDNRGKVIAGTPATLPFWAFRGNQELTTKHQQRLDNLPNLEGSLKLGYLHNDWKQFIGETIEDLNTLEQGPVFDYLIVDEAQNLCDKVFLHLQDALLKDGLKNGRWIMFGDFTNQDIVSPKIGQNGKDALKSFGDLNWEDVTLEINCRNTHEITEKTHKLVGIKSPPMLGVYGPHVQIEYFGREKKLEDILDNLIDDWKNRSFQSKQIILLSSGTGGEFNIDRPYSGWRLLNIAEETSPRKDNTLRYSDVYDFQGLESDLAILVLPQTEDQVKLVSGFTLPRENHLRKVLYTGMSRAKAMLVIVADEHWRTTLERRELLSDELTELQQAK